MKFIFEFIMGLFPQIFNSIVKLVRLEILGAYLAAVDSLRRVFIAHVLAIFVIVFAVFGIALVHVALFLLLPWSTQVNAFIMLGLGLIYSVGSLICIFRLCSAAKWAAISHAESVAKSLSSDD